MTDEFEKNSEASNIDARSSDWAGNADLDLTQEILPIVYGELKRLARSHLISERDGHTFSTTDLVHEAYINLANRKSVDWKDRAHFSASASVAMRRILIDYARRRSAQKRGAGAIHLTLEDHRVGVIENMDDILTIDSVLTDLSKHDKNLGLVVQYRFFGGMTMKEIAGVMGITERSTHRYWVKAKAYLLSSLGE